MLDRCTYQLEVPERRFLLTPDSDIDDFPQSVIDTISRSTFIQSRILMLGSWNLQNLSLRNGRVACSYQLALSELVFSSVS